MIKTLLFFNTKIFLDVDQAKEEIESLAIKASQSYITFYNTTTTAAIGKAMKSVESLMLKLEDMENKNADNPYGNYRLIFAID